MHIILSVAICILFPVQAFFHCSFSCRNENYNNRTGNHYNRKENQKKSKMHTNRQCWKRNATKCKWNTLRIYRMHNKSKAKQTNGIEMRRIWKERRREEEHQKLERETKTESEWIKVLHNEKEFSLYILVSPCALSLRLAIAFDACYYSVCKVNYNVDVSFKNAND